MEILAEYFQIILDYLVILIEKVGYWGVFIGMFLESTFVPIPSEVIMIPAGVAVAYGKFDMTTTIAVGVVGNLLGAIFNYYLAVYFGRPILFKIGKYFFIKEKTIIAIENFFNKHGSVSTFTGRLIPGVRHYISLPAGIARMHFGKFCFYTTTGSAIWVVILTYLGFFIGENQEMIKEYLQIIIMLCLVTCAVIGLAYYLFSRRKNLAGNK
jgi:membrane protein DedA with SNARE-associated domain